MATRATQLLDAWQFTRGIDVHSARRVAAEAGARRDVQVALLTNGVGWIRAEVVTGAPRTGNLLFLPARGLFEVTRRDVWPTVKDAAERVLVTLKMVGDVDEQPEPARFEAELERA